MLDMMDAPTALSESSIAHIRPSALRSEGNSGYRRMEPFRSQRRLAYEKFKGRHYAQIPDRTRKEREPVNLTQQHMRLVLPYLAMSDPAADIIATDASRSWEAKINKVIADEDAKRLKLGALYRNAVIDCILGGAAFNNIGVRAGGQTWTARESNANPMMREFESLLDLDDITVDSIAKTFRDSKFIAYRYAITKRHAMKAVEAGTYGASPEDYEDGQLPNEHIATREEAMDIIENLPAIEDQGVSGINVADISRWRPGIGEYIDQTVYLWDFIYQADGETWILTLPGSPDLFEPVITAGGVEKFLAAWRWDGPEGGPLEMLSFLEVPFNIMPMAIEQLHRDIAEIADLIANKIARQVLNTKSIVVYDPGSEDLAMTARVAKQDQMVRGDPQGITTHQLGGLLPDMIPGVDYFKGEYQAVVGDLTPETITKTATGIDAAQSRLQGFMQYMREQVETFASASLAKRMWFVYKNPNQQRTGFITVGQKPHETSIPFTRTYANGGDHGQFVWKIKAYSMQHRDPMVQGQLVMDLVVNALPTVLEMQASYGLDGRGVIRYLGQKFDASELEMFLPDPMLIMQQQMAAAAGPQMADDPEQLGQQQRYGSTGRRAGGQPPVQGAQPQQRQPAQRGSGPAGPGPQRSGSQQPGRGVGQAA